MSGEMRTCPNDDEPVVFTMEFRGAEYVCVVCGWLGGVLGTPRSIATPERVERHAVLAEQYETEREQRTGRPAPAPPPQDVPPPVCGGCGLTATGRLDYRGKPAHWFTQTRDGVTSYACSRGCIPSNEMVMPW